MNIAMIVAQIDEEIARLAGARNLLQGNPTLQPSNNFSSDAPVKRGRGRPKGSVAKTATASVARRMSAKGKASISAAQKARWAKLTKTQRIELAPSHRSSAATGTTKTRRLHSQNLAAKTKKKTVPSAKSKPTVTKAARSLQGLKVKKSVSKASKKEVRSAQASTIAAMPTRKANTLRNNKTAAKVGKKTLNVKRSTKLTPKAVPIPVGPKPAQANTASVNPITDDLQQKESAE